MIQAIQFLFCDIFPANFLLVAFILVIFIEQVHPRNHKGTKGFSQARGMLRFDRHFILIPTFKNMKHDSLNAVLILFGNQRENQSEAFSE